MTDTIERELREKYAERDAAFDATEAVGRINAVAGTIRVGRGRRRGLRMPRRGMLAPAAAVAAAAVAAGVLIGLHSGGNNSAVTVSTRQVIARTAAFLTPANKNDVLHLVATNTLTVRGKTTVNRTDTWTQEKPPYSFHSASTYFQENKIGHRMVAYVPPWNQISVGNDRTGPMLGEPTDPLQLAIIRVSHDHAYNPNEISSPAAFAQELAKVVRGRGVTVDRTATYDGRPAVAIIPNGDSALYVSPGTYRPLGYRLDAGDMKLTITFNAFRMLPPEALKFPNLILKYPRAKVAAWERTHWREYWSKPSSGTAATRAQALADLKNH